MASISLDPFVGRLISALENEASSLAAVSDEINEMKLLLISMRSFLVDAHTQTQTISEQQKAWIASVRDLAYEVEDTVDEFLYRENRRRQWSFSRQILHFPMNLYVRHRVATKLQSINKRMKSISERAHQFGVQRLEPITGPSYDLDWKNRLSESSLFFKDDDLVGIKRPQHELLGWLMDGEPRRMVISVVGMGGSGKTTLVANTFNKQKVKQHFEFCCWITVSQQYAIEELFRSMVKEVYQQANHDQQQVVPMEVDAMSYRALAETLVRYLQPRRYLIVLDDVWNSQFWDEISIVLPEGMRGSRIMVTTRNQELAAAPRFGFVSYVHQIQPLRQDESWELFRKRAFPNHLQGCPSHLDSLARDLVEKCEGLPLAIVALGGLMSYKKSPAEWKRVHDNLNWELSNNSAFEVVKIISMLSYHDLSFQVKHCFLYCCMFPEDYVIERKRLIRLWMAEGFLERVDDVAPEVVAESYLMELISRSLLQVIERNPSGRVKACKMHDLLREFALTLSKEEKFVAVCNGRRGVAKDGIRRCSIEVKNKEINSGNGTSQLHSLLIFVVDEISKSSFNQLPYGLKLLRVLDLEGTPITELPAREFGKLFNLRYLNISRTQVKVLPKSIGQLFYLQTLLLKGAKIEQLPQEIQKLKHLRHLTGFHFVYQDKFLQRYDSIGVPPNICKINSLQVLSFVKATDAFIKQLKEMTQLTSLGLAQVMEDHEKDLCFAIGRMERLHRLQLFATSGVVMKMDALSSPPASLENLSLAMRMEKVPHWFNSLESLIQLHLQHCELGEDLLSHIQALPNLLSLTLADSAYNGEQLCFRDGFKKLTRLCIF